MLKKTSTIALLLVVSFFAFITYQYIKIPEGVTPLSNQSETLAWLSFGTSIVALLTAMVGLIEKIIGLKKRDE